MRGGRARLLLLAHDTEQSAVLDARLAELVRACRERGVPVLRCLGRRRLGRAVDSAVKQAVVAVLDPDGAYEPFREITDYFRGARDEA